MSDQADPDDDITQEQAKAAVLALKRDLTLEEQTVIHKLYEAKALFLPTLAYVTTTGPLSMRKWQGHDHDPEFTEIPVVPGTTLKIVMVSRMGDCGLTTDLHAQNGYGIRIEFDDPVITNIRWKP